MMEIMSDLHATTEEDVGSVPVEIQRIMHTGVIWLAAVMVSTSLLLGPAVAAGWRPTELPTIAAIPWWLGAVAATLGAAALLWAGCPVMAYSLEDAYHQKVFCIRVGSVLSMSGMALAGFVVLLSPVGGV